MPIFDGGAKSDVKLGFWIGVGLLLLGLILTLARVVLAKAKG